MTVNQTPPEAAAMTGNQNTAAQPRTFSMQLVMTVLLTAIGFGGLLIGLVHMLNDNWLVALILSIVFQGMLVLSINRFKSAREGGTGLLRGSRWFLLYLVIASLIVTFSYSTHYRWMRADRAANEIFNDRKQVILNKLVQLETRYKALSDGFSALAAAAHVRAQEEEVRGNTCKIASKEGPGRIRDFRRTDELSFKDYAAQVSTNSRDVTKSADAIRAQTLGRDGQINETQRMMNEATEKINSGLIGNPMLKGVVRFIDDRLIAADNIAYFGKTIKCEDDQRQAQLLALKETAIAIGKEPPLLPIKLFNPTSVQENALLAANSMLALLDAGLTGKKLADLDPRVKGAKLSTGGVVYLPEDYLPLLTAALVELLLLLSVPTSRFDSQRSTLVSRMMEGEEEISGRNLRKLNWYLLSDPPPRESTESSYGNADPLHLPSKFVRLRPYLFSNRNTNFLIIPHTPNALLHDYASALVLMGEARTVWDERGTIGSLKSETWKNRLTHLSASQNGSGNGNSTETLDVLAIPVRMLEVSRRFHAWLVAQIVDMAEVDLRPDGDSPPPRLRRIV